LAIEGANGVSHDGVVALLIVDDPDELRALHRMLFTRKFDGPQDEFFGSTFIASVQRKILEALKEDDAAQVPEWESWASAAHHPQEVAKVRAYLAGAGQWWQRASDAERRRHVIDLLSPLQADDELVRDLARTGTP
jgi:hypothetical protein